MSSGGTQNATATSSPPLTIVLTGETYKVTVTQGATSNSPAASVLVTPNGEVCNSGCISADNGKFYATGTPIHVAL